MARKLFSQILKEVSEAPDDELKVGVLQQWDTPLLRTLLHDAFDPATVFDVEIPIYRENKETDGYSANNLYVEVRRLYLFKDTEKKVAPAKKKALLAQILESIDVSDAVCLIDVLKKDLGKYGLTKEIVLQAFPGLVN